LDAVPRAGPPPSALFEIWDQPLQAVGPRSLQGHLLKRAGFANIVPETRNEMPLLSGEWVAAARPAVIFHTGLCSSERIAGRPGWKTVPAVQKGHVYKVDADLFSRAGPRILEALAELGRIRSLVEQ
jgi:iron complex transport system substrate-binding protein